MSDGFREGGCGCGAVRYRVLGDPIMVNNCYCTQCQTQTGSTSAINAFYETERLDLLSGTITSHIVRSGSGGDHAICRCSECGVAVWSHYPRMGEHGAGIRVTTLDDPSAIRPDAAIYVADRLPWVTLPEGIPAFDTTYSAAELLAPDRFSRLKALAERAKLRG